MHDPRRHSSSDESDNGNEQLLQMQENQDPDQWRMQRKLDIPVILLTSNEAILLVGKVLVSSVDRPNLKEAFLALIGLFYLLVLDYPPNHEFGFTMLQFLIFGDESVPAEISKTFNTMLPDYQNFKHSNEGLMHVLQ
ncbi:Hypothetical predicted protein [Paramuricea clavata]|uniref:Uncharacterized protein n=1 Tax=Paramuricea clavata TaxID=317549 RepID=A0A7D9JQ09_PARCT|nr:Hypothetical predicted protein [Paramuricea clavata]